MLINALEERGLVRSLAEPNLVALSGDTASFLAGGEFPIPVPRHARHRHRSSTRSYGVGLAFTPTVLQGRPDQSEDRARGQPARSNSHPVHDRRPTPIPPLIVRRASTTIELRDGQSFMIGGLLQNDEHRPRSSRLPWLGDVPVLGALFSSRSYQKNETDLAIIVTPRLVRPARPGDPVKTPLDNTLPANDADFFLMGKAEITPTDARLALGHQTSRSSATFSICRREAPMSSQSRTRVALPALAAASLSAPRSRGCSDIYYDRRETVALGADDRDRHQPGRRRWSIRGRATVANKQHRLQRPADAGGGRSLPARHEVIHAGQRDYHVDAAAAGAQQRRQRDRRPADAAQGAPAAPVK